MHFVLLEMIEFKQSSIEKKNYAQILIQYLISCN